MIEFPKHMKRNFEIKKGAKKKDKAAGISEKVVNILKIYTLMAQNHYPSVKYLQEQCEVGERTIYRYIEIIGLIDDIEFDKERGGYKFTHGDRIKKLTLSEDDFLLLLTMGGTIDHLGHTFKDSFRNFMGKFLNITSQKSYNHPPVLVKIPDAIESENTPACFKSLCSCIAEKRSVDMVYKTLWDGETRERRVDPYGLVFYDSVWILIGYCHMREEVRHFAIDRILDLKETYLSFKLPQDFSINAHLSNSWGIHDNDPVDVTIRFTSKVAEFITRKDKWHPSEKRKLLPNGDVELAFTVAGVTEIKHWIYSWVPNVEVLEPAWFRKQIKEELTSSAKINS